MMLLSKTYQNFKLIEPFAVILQAIFEFLCPFPGPLRSPKIKENSVFVYKSSQIFYKSIK